MCRIRTTLFKFITVQMICVQPLIFNIPTRAIMWVCALPLKVRQCRGRMWRDKYWIALHYYYYDYSVRTIALEQTGINWNFIRTVHHQRHRQSMLQGLVIIVLMPSANKTFFGRIESLAGVLNLPCQLLVNNICWTHSISWQYEEVRLLIQYMTLPQKNRKENQRRSDRLSL